MQIGFVGLGTMGGPMARRLVEQGHRVTGYDVDAARGARARETGVTLAASAAGPPRGDASFEPARYGLARRDYLDPDGVLGT